jgi:hypothetical protein
MSQKPAHFTQKSHYSGNRHTQVNAPETLRAFVNKCGTVRGPIKPQLLEKCFRPKATEINSFFKAELRQSQFSKAELPEATGNRQQATGNRQQATGNYTHVLNNRVNYQIAQFHNTISFPHFLAKRRMCPYGHIPAFFMQIKERVRSFSMKNTIKVKAIQRIAGIIGLMLVIGFSVMACFEDSDDDDSGGGGVDGNTLSGTYYYEDNSGDYVTFSHNGTWKAKYIYYPSYSFSGTYTLGELDSDGSRALYMRGDIDETWYLIDAKTIFNKGTGYLYKR